MLSMRATLGGARKRGKRICMGTTMREMRIENPKAKIAECQGCNACSSCGGHGQALALPTLPSGQGASGSGDHSSGHISTSVTRGNKDSLTVT